MVLVAASGSTSWVCDPSLESYALKQPEMLRSPDYRTNVMHHLSVRPQPQSLNSETREAEQTLKSLCTNTNITITHQ